MSDIQNDVEEYRAFGALDEGSDVAPLLGEGDSSSSLVQEIEMNLVGENRPFTGPYGERQCIYTDWTASGRALTNIEQYILTEVLPLYGNTHTTTSRTGHQSTCFRHESRQIIAQAVNAKITGKAATDIVLFTGNGTTSAINKLVHALGLHLPLPTGEDSLAARPVVFTSAYEHHSNLLPWREAEADVVTIRMHPTTGVCLTHLREQLEKYGERKLKIGAFAAASNVTGMLTDVDAVSVAMHRAGGIVVYDYATAAPYVKVDMNPVVLGDDAPFVYKDAIVFSGHKFVGGPGTPGVLIAKKRLIPSSGEEPTLPGGGTVFYVTDDHHRYLSNREEREEGGTPNVLGDVKLGLVVHLKQLVGASWIENEELATAKRVHRRLAAHPSIHLLGHSRDADTETGKFLPIVSFLVQPRGSSRFLHYNFVCALLNDLFGIQSRGGCMCAGPYSQWLLGLSDYASESSGPSTSDAVENALLDKQEVLRPGYTRFSLPYFTNADKVEYVVKCVEFVADNGALFLPFYRYNHRTGEWAHTSRLTKFPERVWLSRFDPMRRQQEGSAGSVGSVGSSAEQGEYFMSALNAAEKEVKRIRTDNSKKLAKAKKSSVGAPTGASNGDATLTTEYEDIRWFVQASDFPGGIPVASEGEERVCVQGAIRPNLFLVADADTPFPSVPMASHPHEPSLYAQKRDKKMQSREGGTSGGAAALPRYANPAAFVGISDKNSIGKSSSAAPVEALAVTKNDSIKVETVSVSPALSTSGISNKLLGGVGDTFASTSASSSTAVEAETASDNKKIKAIVPPKKILKTVGQAIADWGMIEEGDRLCLGLSGGKDSLAMLHILLHLQRKAPVKFTIACATVDPQTESFDPSPLIPYMQSLGITYHYLSEPIVEMAKTKMQGDSLCAFCARFKRGLLYSCCRNNGYNKLVLAQHLDDLAESFIMSSLHNGKIRTMKAHYKIDSEDLSVIRPLAYTREAHTRDFSLRSRFPVINENCPACFEEPKERARVKKLLSQEEAMIPALFSNLRKALVPFMASETYPAMEAVYTKVEERAQHSFDNRKRATSGGGKRDVTEISTATAAADDADESSSVVKKKRGDNDQAPCTDAYCVPCYELA